VLLGSLVTIPTVPLKIGIEVRQDEANYVIKEGTELEGPLGVATNYPDPHSVEGLWLPTMFTWYILSRGNDEACI